MSSNKYPLLKFRFHFFIVFCLVFFGSLCCISFCLCLLLTLLEIREVSLCILILCYKFSCFSHFFLFFFFIIIPKFLQVLNLDNRHFQFFLLCSFFLLNFCLWIVKSIILIHSFHILNFFPHYH